MKRIILLLSLSIHAIMFGSQRPLPSHFHHEWITPRTDFDRDAVLCRPGKYFHDTISEEENRQFASSKPFTIHDAEAIWDYLALVESQAFRETDGVEFSFALLKNAAKFGLESLVTDKSEQVPDKVIAHVKAQGQKLLIWLLRKH